MQALVAQLRYEETLASVNAGIISADAIGGEVPIVGNVIIPGTAAYFFVGWVPSGAFHEGEKLLSLVHPL